MTTLWKHGDGYDNVNVFGLGGIDLLHCCWKQLPQFYNAHAANAHNTTKERNALQIEKNTCKLRKQLSSFWQRTRCKCSKHNQRRNALQIKCIWLCCEHLQCVSLFVCMVSICTICCQTDENIFLICWCFFYLHVFSEVAARWALSATVC